MDKLDKLRRHGHRKWSFGRQHSHASQNIEVSDATLHSSPYLYIYISIKHLPYSAIPFMHRPSPNLKFDAFTWTKRTIFIKFMHVKLWIWFSCQWSFYVRRRICICNKFSLLVGKIVGGSGWCGADGGMGGVRTTVSDTATNIRPVFNGETKTTKTTNRARPITIHSQQRAINLQKIYN